MLYANPRRPEQRAQSHIRLLEIVFREYATAVGQQASNEVVRQQERRTQRKAKTTRGRPLDHSSVQ